MPIEIPRDKWPGAVKCRLPIGAGRSSTVCLSRGDRSGIRLSRPKLCVCVVGIELGLLASEVCTDVPPPCLQLGVPAAASTNKKQPEYLEDRSYYIFIHIIYFVSALR